MILGLVFFETPCTLIYRRESLQNTEKKRDREKERERERDIEKL